MNAVFTFLIRVLLAFMLVMTILAVFQTVRVERLKEDVRELTTTNEQLNRELNGTKQRREQERNDARQSIDRLAKLCEQERKNALKAGRALEGMLDEEKAKNPDGSRRIIGADELRDLVGQ